VPASPHITIISTPRPFGRPFGGPLGRPLGKQVLEWLRDNPEWHGRGEILAGSGVAIEDWQDAIGQLLNSKYVEAAGNRRLTQYRVA